ncbi:MAG: aldehyde dehydrogenase family protein [Actinobacteria bacterium]|nr:aldehyde dehydrogenase family protein [Actinomycetota bacterium]
MTTLKNFINGKFVDCSSNETMSFENPAIGQVYGTAPLSRGADVDAAFKAASDAFLGWKRTAPADRSLALFRIADAMEARADEIVAAEIQNTGKPLWWMRDAEFPQCVDHTRFHATMARNLPGWSTGEFLSGYDSTVRREPVGVCAQVAPWNYPLLMAVWKFAPALAMGNTIVLKPSDTTPHTASIMAEIFAEHLPAGVANIIYGDRDTGRAMVAHKRPDLVSITGSVRAGMEIAASAAPDLKRVHLELGGKAPVIVYDDCDFEKTVQGVAEANLYNAGQDCAAGTRVIVQEGIAKEFTAALAKKVAEFKFGAPENADHFYGALNSQNQLDRVQGFIDRLPSHAEILTGGKAQRLNGGYYFEPTLVAGLKQDDEMIQTEVFASVQTIQTFKDEAQAIEMANDVDFGLAASIWSENHGKVIRTSQDLDFGQVWVNCHLVQAAEMPNGGFKHSGHGNDLSTEAIEGYTRVKHIMSLTGR